MYMYVYTCMSKVCTRIHTHKYVYAYCKIIHLYLLVYVEM